MLFVDPLAYGILACPILTRRHTSEALLLSSFALTNSPSPCCRPAPRCPRRARALFAKHAKPAGIFQHPRGEFHSHTSRGEPAGLAAVTF